MRPTCFFHCKTLIFKSGMDYMVPPALNKFNGWNKILIIDIKIAESYILSKA